MVKYVDNNDLFICCSQETIVIDDDDEVDEIIIANDDDDVQIVTLTSKFKNEKSAITSVNLSNSLQYVSSKELLHGL